MKSAADYYREELASLSSRVGERNRRLLVIGCKAARAGVAAQSAIDEIIEAGGEPRLTRAEVTRAIEKAYASVGSAAPSPYQTNVAAAPSPPTTHLVAAYPPRTGEAVSRVAVGRAPSPPTSSSFVRDMIALGRQTAATACAGAKVSELIQRLSPIPIAADPRDQAIDFACYFPEADEEPVFFVGDPFTKRTRDALWSASLLAEAIFARNPFATPPTHFMPNDLTGMSVKNERGEDSFAKEACIKHRRYAVIEFDELPLVDQAHFWLGCLVYGKLPIRSLVYSGHKSIHALLRLRDDADYRRQWSFIERELASDSDPKFRCDLACRNPGRLTRFPGAYRADTGRHQTLLYLA